MTPVDAGQEGAAYFPAGCFGKLPASCDFVRHNAAGRDVLAFDRWLQQGLHHARAHLGAGWDDAFRGSPAYHFLFFPENSESFLLGLLWPSHDRSGRQFPFTVSLRVDRRLPPDLVPLAPVVFAGFLRCASALMGRVSRGDTPPDLALATARLRAPVAGGHDAARDAYRRHLAGARAADVWRRLWGGAGGERAIVTFRNLLDVLLPLRGRNAERLALGLRFPTAGDAGEVALDVSFWLDAAFRLAGARSARPFLFWTAPAEEGRGDATAASGHLFVFMRQPSPRSLLHLLRPDLDADHVLPVDAAGADRPAGGGAPLPAPLAALVTRPDAALGSLLEALDANSPGLAPRPGAPC